MAGIDMSGLYGVTPDQAQELSNRQNDEFAMKLAQMPLDQRSSYLLNRGAAMAMKPIMGAFGYVNKREQQAQQRQTIGADSSDDVSTSAGAFAKAEKFRQIGDLEMAMKLTMFGQQLRQQERQYSLQQQKADLEEKRLSSHDDFRLLQLQQAADAAKARSEDFRYSVDQRREAARDANELRMMIEQLKVSVKRAGSGGAGSGGGAGSPSKPKGLTREAGLKWELDNGLIDQATYDAAISASPGGKLRQSQLEAASTANAAFDSVERNINQLYDPVSKKLKPDAQSLFGKYAQYRPEWTMSQESVDTRLALESLTNQVMMANLADAKARVGQSFGSMQVQEWDKFVHQLTSLSRGLSEKQAADAMKYVSDFITNKRAILKKALDTDNVIQARGTHIPAPTQTSPSGTAPVTRKTKSGITYTVEP